MKKLNLLAILVFATMFAACNDNVYEKDNKAMIVVCKELRQIEYVTSKTPWKYEYKITDYSDMDGISGDFYYYSSNNFVVGDSLTFTTKASLKEMHTNIKRIASLETDLLTFISTKSLADSLQTTITNQAFRLTEAATVADSLRIKLVSSNASLQNFKQTNEKNIKLQADLKSAQVEIQKLRKFKASLKALTTE